MDLTSGGCQMANTLYQLSEVIRTKMIPKWGDLSTHNKPAAAIPEPREVATDADRAPDNGGH